MLMLCMGKCTHFFRESVELFAHTLQNFQSFFFIDHRILWYPAQNIRSTKFLCTTTIRVHPRYYPRTSASKNPGSSTAKICKIGCIRALAASGESESSSCRTHCKNNFTYCGRLGLEV